LSNAIGLHIQDMSSTIRLQIFTTLTYVYSYGSFLSNSMLHAVRSHQGPEFLLCRNWVRIAWHRMIRIWRIAKCRKQGWILKDFFRIWSNWNFEFAQNYRPNYMEFSP